MKLKYILFFLIINSVISVTFAHTIIINDDIMEKEYIVYNDDGFKDIIYSNIPYDNITDNENLIIYEKPNLLNPETFNRKINNGIYGIILFLFILGVLWRLAS